MIRTKGRRHEWKGVKGTTIVQLVVHFHSDGSFTPADHRGPDEWHDERTIDKVTTDQGVVISPKIWRQFEHILMTDVQQEPLPNAAS